MRVLIAALVLCVCAWRTHARAQDWRSDQALWAAATFTTPTQPRPWLNLASAELATHQWNSAWTHLRRAVTLADQSAHRAERAAIRAVAAQQLPLLDALAPRCESAAWRGFCASLESP